MTSKVDIANRALQIIGANEIAAFDEDSKAARAINSAYDLVRDSVFRAHPWNCLIRRAALASEVATPAYGYSYQYTLPTDPYCLRVLAFATGDLEFPFDDITRSDGGPVFVVEGRKILTNETGVKIKYVARITDPNEYDFNLIDALSARLAHEICYTITNSTALLQATAALYNDKLKEARFVDATEGAPEVVEADLFVNARY